MPKTCTVSFAIEPLSHDEPVSSIVPMVNGVSLTTLVAEYERVHQYEPAGGYAGLVPLFSGLVASTTTSWGPAQIRLFQTRATGYSAANVEKQVVGP